MSWEIKKSFNDFEVSRQTSKRNSMTSIEFIESELDRLGLLDRSTAILIRKAKDLHHREIVKAANNGCKGMCMINSPIDGEMYYSSLISTVNG